jgi:hypothetical protein
LDRYVRNNLPSSKPTKFSPEFTRVDFDEIHGNELTLIPQAYTKVHNTAWSYRSSTATARLKMPLSSDDLLLVHLPGPMPEGWDDAAAKAFNGLRVRWFRAGFDHKLHMIETADVLPESATEGVTMLCLMPPPQAERFPNVRYVQLNSAGYDAWKGHPLMENPDVTFCTGSGCHA